MEILSYLMGKNASGGGGGGDLDWNAIGYSSTPQTITNTDENIYNVAKDIYDNWVPAEDLSDKYNGNRQIIVMPLVDTSITTNMRAMFVYCYSITEVPQLDTKNVTNMRNMFDSDSNLTYVPVFDLSSITNVYYLNAMFAGCKNLTDSSLDNILQMCINAPSTISGTKQLNYLGFSSTNYPASRIQALPHYQDFLDAGWTIGY